MSRILPSGLPDTSFSSDTISVPISHDSKDKNKRSEMEKCMLEKPFQLSKPLIVSMGIFGLLFLRCKVHRKISFFTRMYSICVLIVFTGSFVQACLFYRTYPSGISFFTCISYNLYVSHCISNAIVTFKACNYRNRFLEFLTTWSKMMKANNEQYANSVRTTPDNYERHMKKKLKVFVFMAWVSTFLFISTISYLLFATEIVDFVIMPFSSRHPLASYVKVVFMVAQTYMAASWIFPIALFMLMCGVIYKEFEMFQNDLEDAIAADETLPTVEYFRCRHQSICQLVETADDILSGFIAAGMLLLTCQAMLILYNLVLSKAVRGDLIVMCVYLIFLLLLIVYLVLIAYCGGYVNKMAHAPLKSIYHVKVSKTSPEFALQMNMFLARLTGESIGLTALDMFVIDKPTILAIAGAFVTYFIVLIQYQPASPSEPVLSNCTNIRPI